MTDAFHQGQGVGYRPYPGAPAEDGVVVRTNDEYVFVRYRGSETPKATRPSDLESQDMTWEDEQDSIGNEMALRDDIPEPWPFEHDGDRYEPADEEEDPQ